MMFLQEEQAHHRHSCLQLSQSAAELSCRGPADSTTSWRQGELVVGMVTSAAPTRVRLG